MKRCVLLVAGAVLACFAHALSLPSSYTPVAYIESTGTQYIKPILKTINNATSLELKMTMPAAIPDNKAVFGFNWNSQCYLLTIQNGRDFKFYGSGATLCRAEANIAYTFACADGTATMINESTRATYQLTGQTFGSDITGAWCLFGYANGGFPASIKLRSLKMWQAGTLIRDLKPCVKSEGETRTAGLYDIVNNVFHTNTGTGAFGYGPDLSLDIQGSPDALGVVSPDYGMHTGYPAGNPVTCTATSDVVGDSGYAATCTGFTLYSCVGSETVISNGTSSSITFTHPGTLCKLVWNWENPKAKLTTDVSEGGTVSVDPESGDGLYATNAVVTLTATENGKTFCYWAGDLPDGVNVSSTTISVKMNRRRTISAIFAEGGVPPIFVKASANGKKNGSSWIDAFTDLMAAVSAAVAAGGTRDIYVAQGVYSNSAQAIVSGSVKVYGGFQGESQSETFASRDPETYQALFTGNADPSVSTYMHFIPTKNGFTYATEATGVPIIKNAKFNPPPAYTGEWDGYYVNRGSGGTEASLFSVSSSGSLEVEGLWILVRTILDWSSSLKITMRDCRFIRAQISAIDRDASAVSFENCDFRYYERRLVKMRGYKEFRNCRFSDVLLNASSGGFIYHWSHKFLYNDCSFSRFYRYTDSGSNMGNAFGGVIISCESGDDTQLNRCVFSNNFSASMHVSGIPFLCIPLARYTACSFMKNRSEYWPAADRAYVSLAGAQGATQAQFDGCSFVSNEVAAAVNEVNGSFGLGLVGVGNNTGAQTFLNCSFIDNVAETAANAYSTPVLSRGILSSALASGAKSQVAVANSAFSSPGDNVADIAQYGLFHTYPSYVMNSIFVRDGDHKNPFYFESGANFIVKDCSIDGLDTPPAGLTITGLEIDAVPCARVQVGVTESLQPQARMPGASVTVDVATNRVVSTVPFFRWRETAWIRFSASFDTTAVLTSENGVIVDVTGVARPFGSFLRGPFQSLPAAAATGHTLVVRASPRAAATFSTSVQVVQPVAQSAVVTFTKNNETVMFQGWYTTNNVLVSPEATLPAQSLTDDTILVAKFNVPSATITFELGKYGTFENTTSTTNFTMTAGSVFPAVPAFTESSDWHFEAWNADLPALVPWTNATYKATGVSKALRIMHMVPADEVPAGSDGTGDSWANARSDVVAAYIDAGRYRGELWFKGGVYPTPGTMLPRSNVALRGGFAGNETSADAADPVAYPTALDGANSQTVLFTTLAPVTNLVATGLEFKGFTCSVFWLNGDYSSLSLSNCVVQSCGAKCAQYASISPRVILVVGHLDMTDCVVTNCGYTLCVLRGDTTTPVPGMTNIFRRCFFENNYGPDSSGGSICASSSIYLSSTEPFLVENCTVRNCAIGHYSSAGAAFLNTHKTTTTGRVVGTVFDGNYQQGNCQASVLVSGKGTVVFDRCSIMNQKTTPSSNNNQCGGVRVDSTGRTYFRDCLFRGNLCTQPVSWSAGHSVSAFAANKGYVSIENCTIEENQISSGRDYPATFRVSSDAHLAIVHCTIAGNTVSGSGSAAGYEAEFGLMSANAATRLSLVNTLFQSAAKNSLNSIITLNLAAFMPSVANCVFDGFDASKLAAPPGGYATYVYTGAIKLDKNLRTNGTTPLMHGIMGASIFATVGRPVWRGTDGRLYFYDATNGDKPWRAIEDWSIAYTDAVGASAYGLSTANNLLADAFGAARKKRNSAPGPINASDAGMIIILR